MKIDITRREYEMLLDILYIADWVMNSFKVGKNPRTEAYKKLEQKIFAYTKNMGFEELVEYNSAQGEYSLTGEYEDSGPAVEFIEEFQNDIFWQELICRLAKKDLIRQLGGVKNAAKLSLEDWIKKISAIEDKYAAEFETRGLHGLRIIGNKEIEAKETPPYFWKIWRKWHSPATTLIMENG